MEKTHSRQRRRGEKRSGRQLCPNELSTHLPEKERRGEGRDVEKDGWRRRDGEREEKE